MSKLDDDWMLFICCCGMLASDDFDKLGDDCVVLDECFTDNVGLRFDEVWAWLEDEGDSVVEEVDVEIVVMVFVVLRRTIVVIL